MADNSKPPEHETYELAEPDEAPAAASPPKPDVAKPAKARTDETYELDEVAEQQASPPPSVEAKVAGDPRFAPTEAPPTPGLGTDPSKPRIKSSVFTPEEVEPAYVSPEVAARRREEARVRAAAIAAAEDARRRKRNLVVIGVVVVVTLIGVVVWKLVG